MPHPTLWTGNPFISELGMFPSNASGLSSRHRFSTFYCAQDLSQRPIRCVQWTLNNYNHTGWFPRVLLLQRTGSQVCVLPREIMGSLSIWSTRMLFCSQSLLQPASLFLELLFPRRAGTEIKMVKINCLFYSFCIMEGHQNPKSKTKTKNKSPHRTEREPII